MWEIFSYLQDPHLVARIQKYYGVIVHKSGQTQVTDEKDKNSAHPPHFSDRKYEDQTSNVGLHQRNDASNNTNRCNLSVNGTKANGKVGLGFASPRPNDPDEYDTITSESEAECEEYTVTNLIWHYLFLLGTALGDEIFYASFIPFWFWNVDGAVGRRVVMVWATTMYIGQGIKDIVRWPRPSCPPVVRLQKKWALEYGMPSTHAMVGVTIPFSVILYTMSRYQYSLTLGLVFAVCWCTLICTSRLYLGMHTVLDIIAGLVLAILLMIPLVPIVDLTDHYLLTSHWSPVLLLTIAILLVVYYPSCDRWTPTRSDTTMVLSVCIGIHTGAWTNYQLGNLSESPTSPPYAIIWPSYEMLGLAALRTVIGFSCIVATRAVCKSASYATLCALLRLNSKELQKSKNHIENRQKIVVELSYTFITYYLLGINTAYLLPNAFRLLGIERPTFYTEI